MPRHFLFVYPVYCRLYIKNEKKLIKKGREKETKSKEKITGKKYYFQNLILYYFHLITFKTEFLMKRQNSKMQKTSTAPILVRSYPTYVCVCLLIYSFAHS